MILSVVGARPQFIKLFPVSVQFEKRGIEHIVIHSGQHYDWNMSALFFEKLPLPEPAINLEVGSGNFGGQTGKIMVRLAEQLCKLNPSVVICYGDTNTTLGTALVSRRLGYPLAHIEAGLRAFYKYMPEEQNRIVADHLADLLFAPTPSAINNLRKEGISDDKVFYVGDVMTESLRSIIPIAEKNSDILQKLDLKPNQYILLTIHRQENTNRPETFYRIFKAISKIGEKVIFPVHPRSRKKLTQWQMIDKMPDNITMIDPVGYADILMLEKNARIIFTDSGGMQKEALLLDTPCLTLRDRTEWLETLEVGANVLVGTDSSKIVAEYKNMKDRKGFRIPECFKLKASELIADVIQRKYD
mgnify:CR=1 FL=1